MGDDYLLVIDTVAYQYSVAGVRGIDAGLYRRILSGAASGNASVVYLQCGRRGEAQGAAREGEADKVSRECSLGHLKDLRLGSYTKGCGNTRDFLIFPFQASQGDSQ